MAFRPVTPRKVAKTVGSQWHGAPCEMMDLEKEEKISFLGHPLTWDPKSNRPSRFERLALYWSFTCNAVLMLFLIGYYYRLSPYEISTYARIPHVRSTLGASSAPQNQSVSSAWWTHYVGDDTGLIAINYADVMHWRLPAAQPSPGNRDQGLYKISGLHSMHCLDRIRQSILTSHLDEPQVEDHDYLTYCLDVVRQDNVCHADDTPLYTSSTSRRAGLNQPRMCRDWNKLYSWYEMHAVCSGRDGHCSRAISQDEIGL